MTEENGEHRTRHGKSHGKLLAEDIQGLVGDIDKAVRRAVPQVTGAAETVGETVKDSVREAVGGVRATRDSVVMIRVDRESLARLDDLTESGIAGSRSEAAAFLISEGIKARQGLFDKIADKIDQIRAAKEELRNLLEEDEAEAAGRN